MTKSSLPPSLLDNPDTYQTKTTGPSLLSSLGNTSSPAPAKKRGHPLFWFVMLPLMLISLVVAAAITLADRTSTPVAAQAPTQIVAITPAKLPAPVQTATIINDPLTSDPHQRLNSALTGTKTVSVPPPVPVPVAPPIAARVSAADSAAANLKRPAPAIKTEKIPADADDHDVKLLTALVASTPIVKEQIKQKPTSTSTPKNRQTSSKTTSKEDNRDVVERKPGDNTANLLVRCKKLGMIEGELCRWRICTDRWETDPVCKTNAHPKPSTADTLAQ